MTPYYLGKNKREYSSLKKKNQSMGKKALRTSKTKPKNEEKPKKKKVKREKKKTDWGNSSDKELRIRHSSHTQIKVYFKKKK